MCEIKTDIGEVVGYCVLDKVSENTFKISGIFSGKGAAETAADWAKAKPESEVSPIYGKDNLIKMWVGDTITFS